MSEPGKNNRSFLRRFAIPISLLLIGVVFEAVNWNTNLTSEVLLPVFGKSGQVVIGRMFAFLIVGLILLWSLLSKQVSWTQKKIIIAAVAIFAVGFWWSIREIEMTGDNQLVIRFRWQPTQDERLEGYRNTQQAESVDISLDEHAPQFTNFLGPKRDGVVQAKEWNADLKAHPPTEVWRRPVGKGYAGFVISGGLAVTIEQREDNEVISAFDMNSGADRWTREYPGHFQEDMGGDGPRATPTIAGNQVYALGAMGLLVSLDLESGKENWQTNILKDAKVENIQWGMSGAPLVTDNLVIVNPGGPDGKAVIAYDRSTGEIKWEAGSSKAGYSSPVLAELATVPQVIVFDATGVAGYDLQAGTELWRHAFPTFNGINVAQPLILPDDKVLVSAGYNSGALLLQVSKSNEGWTTKPVWQNKQLKSKMSSPVYHDGYLYGLDDGILCCLDASSGRRKWKRGRYGHGQLLLCNGVLVIMAESGDLVLVSAKPDEHLELAKMPMLPGGKTWNAPALAENQLLLRNHFEAVLLELPSTN